MKPNEKTVEDFENINKKLKEIKRKSIYRIIFGLYFGIMVGSSIQMIGQTTPPEITTWYSPFIIALNIIFIYILGISSK